MASTAEIAAQIAELQRQAAEAAKREEEERASRPPGLDQIGEYLDHADQVAARERADRNDNNAQVEAIHAAVRAMYAHLVHSATVASMPAADSEAE